jgi:hypothetical protein
MKKLFFVEVDFDESQSVVRSRIEEYEIDKENRINYETIPVGRVSYDRRSVVEDRVMVSRNGRSKKVRSLPKNLDGSERSPRRARSSSGPNTRSSLSVLPALVHVRLRGVACLWGNGDDSYLDLCWSGCGWNDDDRFSLSASSTWILGHRTYQIYRPTSRTRPSLLWAGFKILRIASQVLSSFHMQYLRRVSTTFVASLLSLFALPAIALAAPSIGTVSPVSANVFAPTTVSASVSAVGGLQLCRLYVEAEDVGAMTINGNTASMTHTFTRAGVHTVFVFCKDNANVGASGPNTSVFVQSAGSGSDSMPPTVSKVTPSVTTANVAVNVSVTYSDSGTGVVGCDLYVNGSKSGAMTLDSGTASRSHIFNAVETPRRTRCASTEPETPDRE